MSNHSSKRRQAAWNRAVARFDEQRDNHCLYFVNGVDDIASLSEDAERRAQERGCRCDNGQLRVYHLVDDSITPPLIRTTFIHGDPQCPLHSAA